MTNCEAPEGLCRYKHSIKKKIDYAFSYKGLAYLFLSPTDGASPYNLHLEIIQFTLSLNNKGMSILASTNTKCLCFEDSVKQNKKIIKKNL
jgi:hypothetical protein